MARTFVATLAVAFALAVTQVVAQSFPPTIAVCGDGGCTIANVDIDATGMATSITVPSATGILGASGSFPSLFSLCGNGVCVTVPVKVGSEPVPTSSPPAGMSPSSTCPVDVGVCGDGACQVLPVNKDESGAVVSVGPVDGSGAQGAPGSFPVDVGVCCDGTCTRLPVIVNAGGRKLMSTGRRGMNLV